ncbi:protein kinase family protein [Streptomyces specialis]|uniref:protein kinase n=1 Tax=Streptomyces specialis TaxID=498367 RepID=UPI00073F105A|nr:protein kinase [Streptomyces specialis]
MDTYAGRLLADRYRLPRTPSEEFELIESRAFDTASGQEVLVRQVPLPEIVDAEELDADGRRPRAPMGRDYGDRATRPPDDPVVRRAVEAAAAAARLPDHPRLDQVFDVFVQGDGLWIVSELVPGRPLAAVLAEERLGPYRAAEVAADLLAALRIVHAHGWVHRNVTVRTVMICEDGRAMLTGLAAGAAEEVLCGYDPLPPPPGVPDTFAAVPRVEPPAGRESLPPGPAGPPAGGPPALPEPDDTAARVLERGGTPPGFTPRPPGGGALPDAYRRWETGGVRGVVGDDESTASLPTPPGGAADLVARVRQQGGPPREPDPPGGEGLPVSWDFEGGSGPVPPAARGAEEGPPPTAAERAARSGPIAAYRAGTRAGAARRSGATGPTELPGAVRPSHPVRTGREAAAGHQAPARGQVPAQPGGVDRGPAQPGSVDRGPAQPGGVDRGPAQPGGAGAAGRARYRGPDTARTAERARQARITTVGAVTERWAPEQAGPVYENWRLAPPVGPPADFWALGALLFRVVQGYPPYPEESAAELTQAVCAEQPAFAEDCGALRPIIESLLRQDPTERPSAEELRGWLRSLLRGAPEPEVGRHTVTAPPPALEPGRPSDPRRLPILRLRGELVGPRRRPRLRGAGGPRRMGQVLLTLVLFGLAGAVAYVLAFMSGDDPPRREAGEGPPGSREPAEPETPPDDEPAAPTTGPAEPDPEETDDPTNTSPAEDGQEPARPPEGYEVREDPEGFALTVPEGWERQGLNSEGQVVYRGDGIDIVVVPGRDSAQQYGDDPMDYQLDQQPELADYRNYQYRSVSDLRTSSVGNAAMVEGVFGWQDDGARVAFNQVVLLDGAYHIVMVRGPAEQRDQIDAIYDVTAGSYRLTD